MYMQLVQPRWRPIIPQRRAVSVGPAMVDVCLTQPIDHTIGGRGHQSPLAAGPQCRIRHQNPRWIVPAEPPPATAPPSGADPNSTAPHHSSVHAYPAPRFPLTTLRKPQPHPPPAAQQPASPAESSSPEAPQTETPRQRLHPPPTRVQTLP